MTRKCPDCGFVQPGHRLTCRACGAELRTPSVRPNSRRAVAVTANPGLLDVPDVVSLQQLLGYALLTAFLVYFGASYGMAQLVRPQVPPTFVHQIIELADLVFHEAGHVLFMMFGPTLHALGGSIMQLLIPAICLSAFLTRYRDPAGAAVCVWWLGQNLVSMAPYINDARDQRLVLLGGVTGQDAPGYHDWNTVLTNLGWLEWDHSLAVTAHRAGSLLIIIAAIWAALLVGRAYAAWQS